MQKQEQQLSSIPPPLAINFKTAFEEFRSKDQLLICGIEKIDSILNLTAGDRLAIIGNQKYSHTLLTRFCVNALLSSSSSKKNDKSKLVASSRRFHTFNVIVVAAGNNIDFYEYMNFARQYYRRDVISRVLNNTIITRPFTVYQLADIVINRLPNVIQQYDAKMVIISDLLDMLLCDPQIEVNEARYLINEIIKSITKSKALEDVPVVVSLPFRNSPSNHNNIVKPRISSYDEMVLARFNKSIEITDKENKMIGVKIMNNCKKTNDFHDGKVLSINKRDLLTVSAPTK
jgi:hypothetical protein